MSLLSGSAENAVSFKKDSVRKTSRRYICWSDGDIIKLILLNDKKSLPTVVLYIDWKTQEADLEIYGIKE